MGVHLVLIKGLRQRPSAMGTVFTWDNSHSDWCLELAIEVLTDPV